MRDRNPAKENKNYEIQKFNKTLPTRSFGLSASQIDCRSVGQPVIKRASQPAFQSVSRSVSQSVSQ